MEHVCPAHIITPLLDAQAALPIAIQPRGGCFTAQTAAAAYVAVAMAISSSGYVGAQSPRTRTSAVAAVMNDAEQLDPSHPDWYWFFWFYDAYRHGAYEDALDFVVKVDLPLYFGTPASLAIGCGQLGERVAARKAVRETWRSPGSRFSVAHHFGYAVWRC
jgi:hypothetical protein